MHRFWNTLIRPLLEAVDPRVIVEIGADRGANTKNLLDYCKEQPTGVGTIRMLHSIDPSPSFDAEAWQNSNPVHFVFHREASLTALVKIDKPDVVIIDGDHNWYTVFHELELLNRRSRDVDSPFPVVMFHDVNWPYARRDLYYSPEDIPAVYRRPFELLGMRPGQSKLCEVGGLNKGMFNSVYEGNERNGVLTAIEDFLHKHTDRLDFIKVDIFHGFGVLFCRELAKSNRKLGKIIQSFRSVSAFKSLMEEVERERVENIINLIEAEADKKSCVDGLKKELEVSQLNLNQEKRRLYKIERQHQRTIRNLDKERQYSSQLKGELSAKQCEIDSIRAGLSWRITAPLRAFKRCFPWSAGLARRITKLIFWTGSWRMFPAKLRGAIAWRRDYRLIRGSGLFDVQWYIQSYPEVNPEFVNPILHYMQTGAQLGYNPNPIFHSHWYLESNSDVAYLNMNPLVHFIRHGAEEGRDPSPLFDVLFYLDRYPDVNELRENPLAHYLRVGKTEGRMTVAKRSLLYNLNDFLPSSFAISKQQKLRRAVSVVVPVYAGFDETKECIESVLSTLCDMDRLVIVNDFSPEANLVEYVNSLSADERVMVINNSKNLGFVKSVNAGIVANPVNDVVLLNSDTIVANDWIERLSLHAYSANEIGTVTPFSNNATICSYPAIGSANRVPSGYSVAEIDQLIARKNASRHVDIPTAVGFCMFIRRDCLEQVGLFDAKTFGKGYGEENDFCMRATFRNWRHVLAADVYVYHIGEVSFSAGSAAAKELAEKRLIAKHPHYNRLIRTFLAKDPLVPARSVISAALLKASHRPCVLLVSHALGGGTSKHVKELAEKLAGQINFLLLQPAGDDANPDDVNIRSLNMDYPIELSFNAVENLDFLKDLVTSCGVDRVHVHHTIGYSFNLREFISSLGVPFDFTVHDYYVVCPRIHLFSKDRQFCGEPEDEGCNECLSPDLIGQTGDISFWRAQHAFFIGQADRVFCPSEDVAIRMRRYFPNRGFIVVAHDDAGDKASLGLRVHTLTADEQMRVLILGVISLAKGRELVLDVAALVVEQDLPVSFELLGCFETELDCNHQSLLTVKGRYDDSKLEHYLRKAKPHLVWFPSRVPETYSYTLSAVLKEGLPVLAPSIGAFPERLLGRPFTWFMGDGFSPDLVVEQLCAIMSEFSKGGCDASIGRSAYQRLESCEVNWSYERDYWRARGSQPTHSLSQRLPLCKEGKASLMVVPEGSPPSPCAHIRLLLPLRHADMASKFKVYSVPLKGVSDFLADAVVTHRTAVSSLEMAKRFWSFCRDNQMPLIFDCDDYLLDMKEHPEDLYYQRLRPSIEFMLQHADEVWTATDELAGRFAKYNPRVQVFPNALDENLWKISETPLARPETSVVKIYYIGTMSHKEDCRILGSIGRRLISKYGPKVELLSVGGGIGFVPDGFLPLGIPGHVSCNYPAFVRRLVNMISGGGIGVAPLMDSEFNRAKSPIKFFDYTALGLTSVCSDLSVYQGVVRNANNGMLCENSVEAWFDSLCRLIDNPDFSYGLYKQAHKELWENYTLAKVTGLRADALVRLQREKGRLPLNTVVGEAV